MKDWNWAEGLDEDIVKLARRIANYEIHKFARQDVDWAELMKQWTAVAQGIITKRKLDQNAAEAIAFMLAGFGSSLQSAVSEKLKKYFVAGKYLQDEKEE